MMIAIDFTTNCDDDKDEGVIILGCADTLKI